MTTIESGTAKPVHDHVAAHPADAGLGDVKAHPIWLTVLGFLFGFFLALFLIFTGVLALDSVIVTALPVVFAVAGLVLGLAGRAVLRRAAAETAHVEPPH